MKGEKVVFANDIETGASIETSVESIINNRALWEGDSGSGKSHGMTTMIEKTDGLCQRIVVDLEGEYFTLKNNFSFLLIGKSTDKVKMDIELNTNDIYVEKLAQKLIEKSVDSIIDLSEIPDIATHFLSVFFNALFKYSKLMKRPLLIFVDESQEFAPEKGMGKEESLKAMMKMAKRGRKHGIGLICGTQAIADFSKNVVRQLRMRFIGNCTYDNDVKSACENLGFGKDRQHELRTLAENHEFFVAGQGILIDGKRPTKVLKIKAVKNKTKLYDFDFGKIVKIQEKNPKAIKEITLEFSDIPQLIDSELSEIELLKKENIDLKARKPEIRQIPISQPKVLQENYDSGFKKGVAVGIQSTTKSYEDKLNQIRVAYHKLCDNLKTISDLGEKIKTSCIVIEGLETIQKIVLESPIKPTVIVEKYETKESVKTHHVQNTKLRDGAMKMLKVCAMYHPNSVSKNRVATLSKFTVGGGTFTTYLSELKKLDWININGEQISITPDGLNNVVDIEPLSTNPEEIISMWKSKFRVGVGKMLDVIYKSHPYGISKEDLAIKAEFTVGGGTFNTYLSELKRNGLVEISGDMIKLSNDLFV